MGVESAFLPQAERGREPDFDKTMGGLGSGRRLGHEPRRLVERSFALDIREVLPAGSTPGRRGDLTLWAALILWPVRATYLVRDAGELVVTLDWDCPFGGSFVHLPVHVPARGSHRSKHFRCPRPDHPANAPALATKLYWPVGDPGGFACRRCHRLAYASQQTRSGEPRWMRRVMSEAAQGTTERMPR